MEVIASQAWRRLDNDTYEFICRIRALRTISRPQISFGLQYILPPYFNRYAHNPTQMGYSFELPDGIQTLWMYSLPPDQGDTSPFAGCQALVAENPNPMDLEIHLRMPPDYVGQVSKDYQLQAGEELAIRGAIALRNGPFYEHAEINEKLLGREILPLCLTRPALQGLRTSLLVLQISRIGQGDSFRPVFSHLGCQT